MARTIALTGMLTLALTGTAEARCHTHHCRWAHKYPWQFRYSNVPKPWRDKLARVRWCESRNRPDAYNPAGPYLGLYQYDWPTARTAGFNVRPDHLTSTEGRMQQHVRTYRFARRVGWGPWPVCGSR